MLTPGIILCLATVIILGGVWMQIHVRSYGEQVEEAVKNYKLTSDQAHRRVALLRTLGRAVTVMGVMLLILAINLDRR